MAHESRISQVSVNSVLEINRQSFLEDSKTSRLIITDLVSGIGGADLSFPLLQKDAPVSKCSNFCINPQIWFLITTISITSALVAFAIDCICLGLTKGRKTLIEEHFPVLQFIIWIVYCLSFSLIAASCGKFISSDAEGSGIPEMKAIIGGAEVNRYLSKLTLGSKIVGLVAANSAGLSIGREGPFIHISCIIANQMSRLSLFKEIANPARKKQILAIAVAVGVSVTFGSPIGGLLFSIEVTATYYNVGNLWKSLYAAFLCSLIFKFFEIDELTNLITSRHYADATLGPQLIPFIVEGLLFGLIGSTFVYLTGLVVHLKKCNKDFWLFQRYTYTLIACSICSVTIFIFSIFLVGDRGIITFMFKPEPLGASLGDGAIWKLIVYSIGKFFMTIMSITCPIPCGVFTPIFALGSVLGRLYGELCHYLFFSTHPGVYALVGAACLASSVTHTISVAVIVFELSGQINYLPFMLVAVLASYAVTVSFSSSIYDLLITLKKIPYMPTLRTNELYMKKAKDVAANVDICLHNVTSIRNVWRAIVDNATNLYCIPVVDDSGFLIGEVTLKNLIEYVFGEYKKIREGLVNRATYDNYFKMLHELVKDENEVLDWLKCQKELMKFCSHSSSMESDLEKLWRTNVILKCSVDVDLSPFNMSDDASMVKLHYLFVVLNLGHIYVVSRGRLTGVITREMFLTLH
jgi:chloride channel 2